MQAAECSLPEVKGNCLPAVKGVPNFLGHCAYSVSNLREINEL